MRANIIKRDYHDSFRMVGAFCKTPLRYVTISKSIILIFLAVLSTSHLLSNHSLGADIDYECLGNNHYIFKVTVYRDCAAGPPPAFSPTMQLQSTTCGHQRAIPLTLQSGSPRTPDSLWSSCSTAPFAPCYVQYVYVGSDSLEACPDWVIRVASGSGRAWSTNIQNAISTSQGLLAEINNSEAMCGPEFCNTSPTFLGSNTLTICLNTAEKIQSGLAEIEGDSLIFSLANPVDSSGNPIPYSPPHTTLSPIPSTPAITIDASTGEMLIQAIVVGKYAFAVEVVEYRLGKRIGSVMREYHVEVVNCGANAGVAPSIQTQVKATRYIETQFVDSCRCAPYTCDSTNAFWNSTQLGMFDNAYFVCQSDSFTFQFEVKDNDPGSRLYVQDSMLSPEFVREYTSHGTGDSMTIKLGAKYLSPGYYPLTFYIYDEACPVSRRLTYTIHLYVSLVKPGGIFGGHHAVQESVGAGASSPSDITWGPITASPGPIVTLGDTLTLNANVVNNSCRVYRMDSIPYAPVAVDSSMGTDFSLGSGFVSGPVQIGFDFPFFCGNYQNFYISSAGWISFTNPNGNHHPQAGNIPSSSGPENMIAYLWNNFEINTNNGSWLNYTVTGTAPNRLGILTLTKAKSLDNNSLNNTAQLVLHEEDGKIDIHIQQFSSSLPVTVGIEHINRDTVAKGVSGYRRNQKPASIAASKSESWSFTPRRVGYQVTWSHHEDEYAPNFFQSVDTIIGYGNEVSFVPLRGGIIKAEFRRDYGFSLNDFRIGPYFGCGCGTGIEELLDSLFFRFGVRPPANGAEPPGPVTLFFRTGVGNVLELIDPSSLLAVHSKETSAHLSWSLKGDYKAASLEHMHEVDRQFESIASADSRISFTHTHLAQGIHRYRIHLRDLQGKDHYSEIVETTISTSNIRIFPNPAASYTHFQNPTSSDLNIDLFSAAGAKVGSIMLLSGETQRLDTRSFSSGVYLAYVKGDAEYYTVRFVVTKK